MCNLYTTNAGPAEVAAYFKAKLPTNLNTGEGEVYPGRQGIVVREEAGVRVVESMTWGLAAGEGGSADMTLLFGEVRRRIVNGCSGGDVVPQWRERLGLAASNYALRANSDGRIDFGKKSAYQPLGDLPRTREALSPSVSPWQYGSICWAMARWSPRRDSGRRDQPDNACHSAWPTPA